MKEIYVECKPCYRTKCISDTGLEIATFNLKLLNYRLHFKDWKCTDCHWFITDNLKYIYCYYNGEPIFFRIINISSKPMLYEEYNKIERWHRITKKINKLKEQRKRLMN